MQTSYFTNRRTYRIAAVKRDRDSQEVLAIGKRDGQSKSKYLQYAHSITCTSNKAQWLNKGKAKMVYCCTAAVGYLLLNQRFSLVEPEQHRKARSLQLSLNNPDELLQLRTESMETDTNTELKPRSRAASCYHCSPDAQSLAAPITYPHALRKQMNQYLHSLGSQHPGIDWPAPLTTSCAASRRT